MGIGCAFTSPEAECWEIGARLNADRGRRQQLTILPEAPSVPCAAAVRARAWSIWRAGDGVASEGLPESGHACQCVTHDLHRAGDEHLVFTDRSVVMQRQDLLPDGFGGPGIPRWLTGRWTLGHAGDQGGGTPCHHMIVVAGIVLRFADHLTGVCQELHRSR